MLVWIYDLLLQPSQIFYVLDFGGGRYSTNKQTNKQPITNIHNQSIHQNSAKMVWCVFNAATRKPLPVAITWMAIPTHSVAWMFVSWIPQVPPPLPAYRRNLPSFLLRRWPRRPSEPIRGRKPGAPRTPFPLSDLPLDKLPHPRQRWMKTCRGY